MKIPQTKIALILYTLREACQSAEELDNTLKRVRDIGYEAVQVSGLGDIAPVIVKELLDKHGLYCCGTHENLPNLSENLDDIIAKLKLYNCNFTALGFPGGEYLTQNGFETLPEKLESITQKLASAGIKFGYHNHCLEFSKSLNGKVLLAELYDRTAELCAEIDLHWVARGGSNPVSWIKRVAGRMPVVHFKDFVIVDNEPKFCEIGEGNLEWPEIIEACEDSGVRWYVVEQDLPFGDRDIFESAKISFDNLKMMGVE